MSNAVYPCIGMLIGITNNTNTFIFMRTLINTIVVWCRENNHIDLNQSIEIITLSNCHCQFSWHRWSFTLQLTMDQVMDNQGIQ